MTEINRENLLNARHEKAQATKFKYEKQRQQTNQLISRNVKYSEDDESEDSRQD